MGKNATFPREAIGGHARFRARVSGGSPVWLLRYDAQHRECGPGQGSRVLVSGAAANSYLAFWVMAPKAPGRLFLNGVDVRMQFGLPEVPMNLDLQSRRARSWGPASSPCLATPDESSVGFNNHNDNAGAQTQTQRQRDTHTPRTPPWLNYCSKTLLLGVSSVSRMAEA